MEFPAHMPVLIFVNEYKRSSEEGPRYKPPGVMPLETIALSHGVTCTSKGVFEDFFTNICNKWISVIGNRTVHNSWDLAFYCDC